MSAVLARAAPRAPNNGRPEPLENGERLTAPDFMRRYEAMLDACGVPEASRRKIFGETIAGILRLKITV